jgi:hypothetical protein
VTAAADWITFRLPAHRVFVMMLLISFASWVVAQAFVLIFRRPLQDLLGVLLTGVIYAASFSSFWLLFHRRRGTWIRISGPALELARRGRPVVLSWEAVESATIRRPGPFAVLHVALRPDAVAPPAPAQRPRQRRGRPTYIVDVGLLQPGVESLQTELARHLPESPG